MMTSQQMGRVGQWLNNQLEKEGLARLTVFILLLTTVAMLAYTWGYAEGVHNSQDELATEIRLSSSSSALAASFDEDNSSKHQLTVQNPEMGSVAQASAPSVLTVQPPDNSSSTPFHILSPHRHRHRPLIRSPAPQHQQESLPSNSGSGDSRSSSEDVDDHSTDSSAITQHSRADDGSETVDFPSDILLDFDDTNEHYQDQPQQQQEEGLQAATEG